MFLVLRSGVEPRSLSNAVGEQVRSVDKDIPVYLVRTMDDLLSASVAQPRLNLALLAIFASLAVLLAAIGIYGVNSYGVTQRMHELGIRMALGARPRDVMNMVLGQGMRLALVGIGAGLLFAFVLTRLMAAMIFGISTHDLGTFAVVTLFLVFVAAVACWIPARRATRVNPMVALRHE
jgi:putative ABC transport system permease protein